MNALFMVFGAAAAALLFAIGLAVTDVFLVIAAANVIAAWYVCKLLPTALMKGIAAGLLRLLYRVELRGREHLVPAGLKAVVVGNPVFSLQGAMLGHFVPAPPVFGLNTN